MSLPLAAKRPDDTGPPIRGATGFVCPRCHKRFDESAPSRCPDDQSPLIRVRDMADADGDPMLGRTLSGRFTVLAKLGAGSMGTVYRARQHAMGRDVAVKILRSDRAVDNAAKGRFMREARANSALSSPHTVTVFDFGQSETGELYLAMELLEGESLGQRLKRQGRLSIDQSIELARQALRSLDEAHAKGIIHRDLKPDNLFFARQTNGEETVKVVDFGIAKLVHDDVEQMNAVETQAGTVFGTPRYMSPEQAQGKPLDARSDLYSLGVILYHCLTGRPPFTDDDAIVVMARHIKTMPRMPSEVAPDAQIPAELEAVVMRSLSKEPQQRHETADAMAQDLSRVRELGVAATSGVRVNAGGALARAVEMVPSLPTPAIAFRPDADESLTAGAVGVPRRGGVIVAAILSGAAVVVILVSIAAYVATRPAPAPALTIAAPPTTAPIVVPPPPPPAAAADTSAPAVDPASLPVAPSGPKAPATAGNKPPRGGSGAPPPPATGTAAKPPAPPTPPAPTKYEKFE